MGRQTRPGKRDHMQILLPVDQAAAIRLGHDAPAPTTTLTVDPAEWTELEREVIAAIIVPGSPADGTRRGLDPARDRIVGVEHWASCRLSLHRCDLTGLRDAIGRALASHRDARRSAADERAAATAAADAEIERALSEVGTETVRLALDGDRIVSIGSGPALIELSVPALTLGRSVVDLASPGARERYLAAVARTRATRDAMVEAARPRLVALAAERAAAEQARIAAEEEAAVDRQAAISELVRTHGTTSQVARLTEGLLPEGEITTLLRDVALGSIQAPRYQKIDLDGDCDEGDGHASRASVSEASGAMDAERYGRLCAIRSAIEGAGIAETLPGATVETTRRLHHVWCGNEDCDAEVFREGLLVTVTWRGLSASREYAL